MKTKMKKKQIIVDHHYIIDLHDFNSIREALTYYAQLYISGYDKLDYDCENLIACKTREETDEEFNKRIKNEKEKRAKRNAQIKREKEQQKEKRREQYEKLKKEFEDEA